MSISGVNEATALDIFEQIKIGWVGYLLNSKRFNLKDRRLYYNTRNLRFGFRKL